MDQKWCLTESRTNSAPAVFIVTVFNVIFCYLFDSFQENLG